MISDLDVERAVDFLLTNAKDSAECRANRVYAEEYRKSLKAILMKEYASESIGAQEREAYAHEKYLEHLKALKKAVFEDERNRALRHAAEMKVEAWRSQQANMRAVKL